MGSDSVLLVVHGAAHNDQAVLEDSSSITENEVNGARYDTIAEELTTSLNIESVLVSIHAAVVEGRKVRLEAEGYCLVFHCPSSVTEAHVLANEALTKNGCKMLNVLLFPVH
jgi:hypothetical protein